MKKNREKHIIDTYKQHYKMKRSLIKGAAAGAAALLAVTAVTGGRLMNGGMPGRIMDAYAATSEEEIQNSRDKINENKKKIEELNSQKSTVDEKLDELNQLKSDAAEYIAELDRELGSINTKMKDLEAEISNTEAAIEETGRELELAKENEEEQYSSMKLRIRFMYERGTQNLINTLFESGSLSDMLNKAEYISNVSDYDRKKLDEYVGIKHEIEAKEEELKSENEVLNQSKNKLEEQKADVEKLQNDKAAEIASYNAQISEAESDIEAMSADIAGIQKAIEAEENNIASIEARIRAEEEAAKKKAEESGETYVTKTVGDISFTWPCPASSRITSSFGDRESPTEGASSNHKGVDIGASTGSAVLAAADGTVVIATYSASAGNYVMINHGGGVYTVYMHMSSIAVSVGQEVSRGETVGAVGSTGYSTGPHLHFGLRINGTYVNPLSYVSP